MLEIELLETAVLKDLGAIVARMPALVGALSLSSKLFITNEAHVLLKLSRHS